MQKTPRCLAFDLGKVIFDFDYTVALERIKNDITVPIEKVLDEVFMNNCFLDFEKGLVSDKEFYAQFIRTFGSSISYGRFVDIWSDIFTPKQEIITLLGRLRLLYPLYLVSNINELHYEHLYRKHPDVFGLFNGLLLSYQLKSLKPEEKFYAHLKKVSGCEYREIVYVDDRKDLIDAAQKLNLACILFQDFTTLLEGLVQAGIEIPTGAEANTLTRLRNTLSGAKRPLIVGIGNTMRADDGAGAVIAATLVGAINITVINAGASIENYLGKIDHYNPDCVIIVDAAEFQEHERFALYDVGMLQNISLHLTHDSSLKLALTYLQNIKPSDILILTIRPKTFTLGAPMSADVHTTVEILNTFFLNNFRLS
ncbi:MAG: hydrogenase maturation protease [Candidatus Omnitrophota bacterium]|nr:hydrogenase maturation protease [Candidatus Omnitrophota bacterium]